MTEFLTIVTDYLTNDKILEHNFNFSSTFKVRDQYFDTIKAENKSIENLTIEEFGKFSDLFEPDVKEVTLESSIDARDVYGGTARSRVALALKDAKSQLKGQING